MPSTRHRFSFSVLAIINMALCCSTAHALTNSEIQQLRALDPQTRIEQRCDIEAMERINKETKRRTDKVLAYAYKDPIIQDTHMQAAGAAFRAGGQWYHLAYSCKTGEDRIKIISFSYKIGSVIPRSEWDAHYLVP